MNTISRRTAVTGGLTAAAALTLAACGGSKNTGLDEKDGTASIRIGASPSPHVEILQWVQDNLTEGSGITLDIVPIDDYQTPNASLNDGSLAANYFQTPNFLATEIQDKGYDFVALADVHVEPLAIYTDKGYTNIDEIADGGTILLNDDPANTARGLKLCETAGLIELDPDVEIPTTTDVTSNPKNLEFKPVDGGLLVPSLPDVEAAVVNGNFALDHDLSPSKDAIAVESGQNSPYANQLVVRTEDKDNEDLKKLAELLNSDGLRTWIESRWTDGSVIPAF